MTMFKHATRLALVASLAGATVHAGAAEILPLSQVRPGMIGVGRTVFEGSRVDEFKVEVIGVLENVLGPGASLILARFEGGPLEKTGVIAGMSGSPVFIDGKLVGAVSYSFPFAKETIGGVTPIADMMAATQSTAPRAASTRFVARLGRGGPARPLDRAAVIAALQRPLRAVTPDASLLRGFPLPPELSGASLMPLSLPLTFSGFEPSTFEWARGVFSGLGFAPVMGASRGAAPGVEAPPLEPGSAVGVSLIDGDFDLSASGTVTYIDGERLYAFGHPFYNLGPTQFPLKKAFVYSVFPSLYSSFKITAATDVVGTMDQDRASAISGHLGPAPRMIPVEVHLTTSRAQERKFSFRVVEDELLSFLHKNPAVVGNLRVGV
jgi:hypothetical protein